MGKNKGGVSKQQYKKNEKKQQQHVEKQQEKREETKNKRDRKREKNQFNVSHIILQIENPYSLYPL